MFQQPPPAAAGLHLASAVNCLRLADEAINAMMTELFESERGELHRAEFDQLYNFQAACRLFSLLFSRSMGDRDWPQVGKAIRECITGKPAGIERAAIALEFAGACFEQAQEEFDKSREDSGAEWYDGAHAAQEVFALIQAKLEEVEVQDRYGDLDQRFFLMN